MADILVEAINACSLAIITAFMLYFTGKRIGGFSDAWWVTVMATIFIIMLAINIGILVILWYIATGDRDAAMAVGALLGVLGTLMGYFLASKALSRPKNTSNKPKNS